MRAAALLLLTACARPYLLPEAAPDPAVREIHDVKTYRITGGNNGQRGSALTTWDVQYDYSTVEAPGSCSLEKPHVTLGIRQALPVAVGADPAVDLALLNGMDILVKHEDGHLQIDRAGAHWLADALRNVPPQKTCAALAEAVRTAALKAIDRCRAANDAFDAATQHGTSFSAR